MKRIVPALSLALATLICGCLPMNSYQARRQAPAPCSTPVAPIRYVPILAVINVNFTYTPKDGSEGRDGMRMLTLQKLNDLGKQDGNSFTEPNGQQPNLHFYYTFNNDGQDHFTGSVELSGWGQGHINTFYRTQYTYSDPVQLAEDLTSDAYQFIHLGWHDSRSSCQH